ncbi:MAG: hypothetical protein ACRCRZ_00270 [Metamycoplasmataceae bacterium]
MKTINKEKILNFFNAKNSKRMILVSSFSIAALSITMLTTTFLVPEKKASISFDSELEKNMYEVNDFVDNFKLNDEKIVSPDNFLESFIVVDENGENTNSYRGQEEVLETYYRNGFKFMIPKKISYWSEQKGIKVNFYNYNPNSSFISVIPSEFDSSYPSFFVSFSKGVNENKYERHYNVGNSNLFGFKKSKNEETLSYFVNNILNDGVELKSHFYDDSEKKIIKSDVFAKNITETDIVLKEQVNKFATENKISYKISSIYQDNFNPSQLKINFSLSIGEQGIDIFKDSYHQVYINNFNVEQGVDDPKSKVINFINNTENIANLQNSLILKNVDKDFETNTITVLEARDDLKYGFDFELPASKKNLADSAGVRYFIKKLPGYNFVYPSHNDSTTASFEVFICSGEGTSNYFEKSFEVISSLEFKKTNTQEKMELIEANFGLENSPLKIEANFDGKFNTMKLSPGILEDFFNDFLKKQLENKGPIYKNGVSPEGIQNNLFIFKILWTKGMMEDSILDDIDVNKFSILLNSIKNSQDGSDVGMVLNFDIFYGDYKKNAFSFNAAIRISSNDHANLVSDNVLSGEISSQFLENLYVPNNTFLSYKNIPNNIDKLKEQIKLNSLPQYLEKKVLFVGDIPGIDKNILSILGTPNMEIEKLENFEDSDISIIGKTLTLEINIKFAYWNDSQYLNAKLNFNLNDPENILVYLSK